jgi:CDP-4-dehydro-6-deoxyglucose reductase
MPPGFAFEAGQYIEVMHPEGAIPLSIASGPRQLPELHLHYRTTPGVAEARWMDELLARARTLDIRGPLGDVRLPTAADALLLVAGGTGISQALSMIDELAARPPSYPVSLLWCVDQPSDLYCANDLASLAGNWLDVESAVDASRSTANRGLARLRERARLCKLELAQGQSPREPWVLLAGSPGFVYEAMDTLLDAGIGRHCLHSDVFAYAPRPR